MKEESKKDIINWLLPRLNGEDGLGGIFPAMVNALIAFKTVDENKYKNQILTIKKSIDNLIIEQKIQHTASPVFLQYGILGGWDWLILKIIFLQMILQTGF